MHCRTLIKFLPFALLLIGCNIRFTGEQDRLVYLTIHHHNTPAPIPPEAGSSVPVLAMEHVTSDLECDSRRLIVRPDETSGLIRHYDDTHNWVSFPRQMIEQRAREVLLHESKGSMRISGYPSDLPTSLRLKIHLLRFEEVRDDVESQGNAVVAIEYVLHLRNPSGSGWIQVGPKRITATAPIRHDILFRNFDPYTFSLGMR
ncbi:MAG: hypothetical protein QF752_16400, partial [Planctomycetota bacterium]|nr:hypothetical protein [Planctomycetota bacterium]